MEHMNKVMTLTALLLIAGQALCSARVYDDYAQYGMPAETVGSQGVSFVEEPVGKSTLTRSEASKAINRKAYDPYAQYGMTEEAVGLQETRAKRGSLRRSHIARPVAVPQPTASAHYDPYAQYGIPAEALGSQGVSFEENLVPKATNRRAYDPYEQYGMPEEAVGLQETRNARRRPVRQSSYTPIDAERVD